MKVEPRGQSKRQIQAFAIGDFRTCVWGETTHNLKMSYPANKWTVNQSGQVFINMIEVKR